MRKPLNEWCFRVDQDMMPEWHDAKSDEARARAALDEWFKAKVLLEGCREINSEQLFAFGSSRVEAWGSSRVVARGSSRVVARESSRVEARESSRVVARESSSVEACESSRVEAWGSSSVVAWGSSSVVARGSSRVVARGDSTVNNISSSKVLHPKERAVVIDRRNGTPVCITSDMKKEKN